MSYPPTVGKPAASKRERTRLAKAEVWMELATTVEGWSQHAAGTRGRPYTEWSDEELRADPLASICRRYGLTYDDLARLLHRMGGELETKALNGGYEDAWLEDR